MNGVVNKAYLLLSITLIGHCAVNELYLPDNYQIQLYWLIGFYVLSFSMGLLINLGSEKVSKSFNVQIGQAFMILSTLKLIILATLLIVVIKRTGIDKLAGVLHFIIPYYFGTGIAVLKLLIKENLWFAKK